MLHLFRPHHVVPALHQLDYGLLHHHGIRGVMMDLDNTLAPWRRPEVTAEVEAWVDSLREADLRACIVTNASNAARVLPVAERLDIPWVTGAAKPLPGGFQRGMRALGTTPDTTAMVGDMLFTDIYGGNRLGLLTVLVEPLSRHEWWLAKYVQRPLEQLIGRRPGMAR